jgi:hypothetical protein
MTFEDFIRELGFKKSTPELVGEVKRFYKEMEDGRVYCLEYNMFDLIFRSAFRKNMGEYLSKGWKYLHFSDWVKYDETVMMVDGMLIAGFGSAKTTQSVQQIGARKNNLICKQYDCFGNTFHVEMINLENKNNVVQFLFHDECNVNRNLDITCPKEYPVGVINRFEIRTTNENQLSNPIEIITTSHLGFMQSVSILPKAYKSPIQPFNKIFVATKQDHKFMLDRTVRMKRTLMPNERFIIRLFI